MKRTLALVLLVALGGWEPFRSPNRDVEAGNEAYAKGDYDGALAHYGEASKDANVDKAERVMGWKAQHSIEEAIDSALKWGAKREEILGYE